MDFDQLKNFLLVAELGNFTRAANQLQLSQSTLSRAIQRLEDELGHSLFERRARSVVLTDAGVLLQSRVKQILTILEDTQAEIADDGQHGRIRIGAIPTIAPYFLPDLLRKFATAYPLANMLVQEETTDNLLRRCKDGDVDFAILALPINVRYLEIEELFDEELFLVMPENHELSKKKRITLEDTQNYPFVMLDEAHCLASNIVAFCRQRSINPVTVERTSQLAMVQELVSLSHGLSMIPAMARRLDQASNRVYRSLSGEQPMRKVVVIWNSYRFQSQLATNFQKHLRRYARSFQS